MLNTLKQLWPILTTLVKRRILLLLAFVMAMTLFECGMYYVAVGWKISGTLTLLPQASASMVWDGDALYEMFSFIKKNKILYIVSGIIFQIGLIPELLNTWLYKCDKYISPC